MPPKIVKRPANSPLQGTEKERKESVSSVSGSIPPISNIPVGEVAKHQANSQPPGYSSYASATTASNMATATDEELSNENPDTSIFKTSKPNGAFRDEIVVEVNTIDGEPYRGTVTTKEAIKTIFMGMLGFSKTDLGSLTIGYSMGRIITFKLLNQFNIDQLESIEHFDFKRESLNRSGQRIEITMGCKIRGIRKVRVNDQNDPNSYADTGHRWLKIEGCEYRIEKKEIHEWLSQLGEVVSDITEDKVECDFDSDSEEDISKPQQTIGSGTYSVKMKLTSNIPQFLPMCGKRIRLYHRGIIKLCTNCFGAHQRKVCKSGKVPWINYVRKFMRDYPDIPESYYGLWSGIIKNTSESNATRSERTNSALDADDNTNPEQAIALNPTRGQVEEKEALTDDGMSMDDMADANETGFETNRDGIEINDVINKLRGQGLNVMENSIKKIANAQENDGTKKQRGSTQTKTGRGNGRGGRPHFQEQ